MDLEDRIKEMVGKKSSHENIFLIDVVVKYRNGVNSVTIILDGDNGVTISDCVRFSKYIEHELEGIGFLKGTYDLKVCSPGIDQPLKTHRQYKKNIGRRVKITLVDNNIAEGTLLTSNEDFVTLEQPDEKNKIRSEVKIAFDKIVKTNVLVSFK